LGQELRSKSAEIVAEVERAPACLILQGTLPESPDLDYLRDTVGLLTWCLDNSGRIIFDVQTFEWWTPEDWRSKIFRPAAAVPRHHVVILVSEDDKPNTKWFHTRGMQKFGRPDISVRHVPPALKDGVIDLCNRFIDFQAFGGVVAEGEEVRMASLPPGGTVRHGGDLDDPDFNNVHMEIVWPGGL
jgi:hypothetical protein